MKNTLFNSEVQEKKLILANFQESETGTEEVIKSKPEVPEEKLQKSSTDYLLPFFKPSTEDVFQPKSELQDEDMYMAPGMTKSEFSKIFVYYNFVGLFHLSGSFIARVSHKHVKYNVHDISHGNWSFAHENVFLRSKSKIYV